MTLPRQLLPGSTYLLTRRCSERRFFLRPRALTTAIFKYALAVSANRHRIQVHAFCVLSNHFHLVVTDPDARLPEFHRDLDGIVARATNHVLGRRDALWDRESYNATRLEDRGAVLAAMIYVLANPVAAGLVRRAAEWPGLWSDPGLVDGGAVVAARPAVFFRAKGGLPEESRFLMLRPPGFEAEPAFVDLLRSHLRQAEDEAAVRLAREGRSFLTAAVATAQSPYARPSTVEASRRLKPRVASRDPELRRAALRRIGAFVEAHREARAAWLEGMREVLFPPGTWLMRVQHGARCAPCG